MRMQRVCYEKLLKCLKDGILGCTLHLVLFNDVICVVGD